MLELIRIEDRQDLVLSMDPAVHPPSDCDQDEQAWREAVRALPAAEAQLDGAGDPLIFTVRALNAYEALRVVGAGDVESVIQAARIATVRVRGGGINAKGQEAVDAALQRLPVAALSSLGAWVLKASVLSEDPTAPGV